METVQLQCGGCKKLMAIAVQHMGGKVQCPHCKTVVQTPPRTPPAEPPPPAPAPDPPAPAPSPEAEERESIFGDIGRSEAPTLESPMPADEPRMPAPEPPAEPAPASLLTEEPAPAEDAAAELRQFKRKPIFDRGVLTMSALIFLIPYAILTTIIIVVLVILSFRRPDPLEHLRDPAPNPSKGGPRRAERPKHDLPLAAHLRTQLGKPIQAGDLRVTPTRVRLTRSGDLQLLLRAENTSGDTTLEPIHLSFMKLDLAKPDEKPYSFLESRSRSVENVYGLDLGYHKDAGAADEPRGNGTLNPSGEITIALTTYEIYRSKHVATIAKSNDEYLWRVQVRRGFVKVDGKDVSATMVVGVEFSSSDIEADAKNG